MFWGSWKWLGFRGQINFFFLHCQLYVVYSRAGYENGVYISTKEEDAHSMAVVGIGETN